MPSLPVPLPTAAPDEPPFIAVRFNREWLAIILGALEIAYYNPAFFDASLVPYGENVDILDQLELMLMTEVFPEVTGSSSFVHPLSFEIVSGTWVRGVNSSYPYLPYIYNSSLAGGDSVRFPVNWPAGVMHLHMHIGRGTAYGYIAIFLDDDAGSTQLTSVLGQNGSTDYLHIENYDITFTEPFSGYVRLVASGYPAPNGAAREVLLFGIGIHA